MGGWTETFLHLSVAIFADRDACLLAVAVILFGVSTQHEGRNPGDAAPGLFLFSSRRTSPFDISLIYAAATILEICLSRSSSRTLRRAGTEYRPGPLKGGWIVQCRYHLYLLLINSAIVTGSLLLIAKEHGRITKGRLWDWS